MVTTFVAGSLALIFVLHTSVAAAQDTFKDLPAKVKLGQKLVVEDAQGNKTLGTVASVSYPSRYVSQ